MSAMATSLQVSSRQQHSFPPGRATSTLPRRDNWGNSGLSSARKAHGINGLRLLPFSRPVFLLFSTFLIASTFPSIQEHADSHPWVNRIHAIMTPLGQFGFVRSRKELTGASTQPE